MHCSRSRSRWLLTLLLAAGCASSAHPRPTRLAPDVTVQALAPGVWLHVTRRAKDSDPANGLVIDTPDGAILVDAAWTPAQAERLSGWAQKTLRHKIVEVVITHDKHDDRVGGLEALKAAGAHIDLPSQGNRVLELGGERLEVMFPGGGHTRDNVVVWLARARLLFGGCMIKSADATDLGHIDDADLASWPGSLDALSAAYPTVELVVPGHGAPGSPALLQHTKDLLARHK